jgi:hypothetical protein
MIVNAAVFTCSICGEASVNICSYCTKDACSNHRCERCKRCSDCCECDVPLSAEEPVAPVAVTEAAIPSEIESQSEAPPESAPVAPSMHSFLTAEESSVFAEESAPREPRYFGQSSVFAEEASPQEEELPEEELPEDELAEDELAEDELSEEELDEDELAEEDLVDDEPDDKDPSSGTVTRS